MAWFPYFEYGGVEIINAERVEAYAAHEPWFTPAYHAEAIGELYGQTYISPQADPAPWVDPDDPDTFGFYGVYPLNITGFEDSTRTSDAQEATGHGGTAGTLRFASRAVVYECALFGDSECAVEKGLTWLRKALTPDACEGSSCGNGEDLCYFACEPCRTACTPGGYETFGANLVTNSDVEADTTNYAAPFGTLSQDCTQAHSGSCSAMTHSEGSILRLDYGSASSDVLPAEGGKLYRPDAWVRTDAARTLLATTRFYDASGALLYSSAVNSIEVVGGQWAHLVGTVNEAPEGTTRALLSITAEGGATTGDLWVDDLAMYEMVYRSPGIAEICRDENHRTLRNVVFNSGPTVTARRTTTNGGAVWVVTFTGVTGTPWEYGPEELIVEDFGSGTDPWVPSIVPADWLYDDVGEPLDDSTYDCSVQVYDPLVDPLCPAVELPPEPPPIPLACWDSPNLWTRRWFTIPRKYVPYWGDVIPNLTIQTLGTEVRGLRVRFYSDLDADGSVLEDPCNFCGDIVFTYIPPETTMTLDGTTQTAQAEQPGGVVRRADSLIVADDGRPFDWPLLTCGLGYVVSVDVPEDFSGEFPLIDLSLRPRVAA